jgi:hypothetical protein
MSMTRHEFFKKRLEMLGVYDKDADYGGLLGQWVEELSEVFSKQRHSGMSAVLTLQLFTELTEEWKNYGQVMPPSVMEQPVLDDKNA